MTLHSPFTGSHAVMTSTAIDLPTVKRVGLEISTVPRAPRIKKRERRLQRDQSRPINAWQQYRALWDGIDFKRQILNMGDKKVRFALVIMGALNALFLLVLVRDPMLRLMPALVRVGLASLLVVYGVVTFRFMAHAIEALRPAPEAWAGDKREWDEREGRRTLGDSSQPIGYIIRSARQHISFDDEKNAWSHARLEDINSELILFNRATSYLLSHQASQLRRVYQDLKILLLVGAMTLALVVAAGIWRGNESVEAGVQTVGSTSVFAGLLGNR